MTAPQPVAAEPPRTRGEAGDIDASLAVALARLAAGDNGALEVIWGLMADSMYGLARWRTGSAVEADDVVQEAFVRLVRFSAEATRAERPRAYLLAIVRRVAIDALRRRRHEPLGDAHLLVPADDTPERVVEARRASELVGRLGPKQRESVYLRHFAGLTFEEIGRVAGVPTFTAASRYRLALAQLRRWMGVER
jgi:RNA polymerase sigma-70 factor, ECF subfamily